MLNFLMLINCYTSSVWVQEKAVLLEISTCRDVVAMEMGPHVAPANKNVAPGAKQLLIINISNYTVL